MQTSSKYLMRQDDVLLVNKRVAFAIGTDESVAVSQIDYWLNKNMLDHEKADSHYFEGRWWCYNSYAQWRRYNFQMWSQRKIETMFQACVKAGYVLMRPNFKGTVRVGNWYSIDYELLDSLVDAAQAEFDSILMGTENGGCTQNGVGGVRKTGTGCTQNGEVYTEITSETTEQSFCVPDGTLGDEAPSGEEGVTAVPLDEPLLFDLDEMLKPQMAKGKKQSDKHPVDRRPNGKQPYMEALRKGIFPKQADLDSAQFFDWLQKRTSDGQLNNQKQNWRKNANAAIKVLKQVWDEYKQEPDILDEIVLTPEEVTLALNEYFKTWSVPRTTQGSHLESAFIAYLEGRIQNNQEVRTSEALARADELQAQAERDYALWLTNLRNKGVNGE